MRPPLIAASFLSLVLTVDVTAAPSVAEVLTTLHKRVDLHGVAISPDGMRVAWVEQQVTRDGPAADRSSIFVLERGKPEASAQRISARSDGPYDESNLDFSPDGTRLAFLSDAEKRGQLQVYVADLASRKVTQLTHLVGHLATPRFSPDGAAIAFLFLEGEADARGPLGPATRQTGVVAETIHEQRIHVVAATGGGAPRAVSPAPLFVYEYDWRPDGKAFAAVAAPGSGDDNWWIAKLHVFEQDGASDRVVHQPALQIAQPTFSPDGTRIAFIEGIMSDAGSNGGDVYVVPGGGGAARNVTPGMRGSAASLRWEKPEEIFFGLQIAGEAAFATVAPSGGKVEVRWKGPLSLTKDWGIELASSRDGSVTAAVAQSFDRPDEIVAGPLGDWKPLTRRNQGLASPAGAAQSISWKSDRYEVQGWLIAPPNLPANGEKAPMVVIVHGGPASGVKPTWSETALLLASQGYFVFMPNPRGSYGQGEAFTRANVKDFGHGDLGDILAGIDAVVRQAPVDPDRVGIFGHSYGGFMAMFAPTQTRRFRAAVASAGIANWQSYYGQNRIDQWMIPYFGKSVYEDPAVYARSSAITYILKAKTPTLIMGGERDSECPIAQSQEMWHALKTLGIETQLVVYADEGHHFRDPAHARDHDERMVAWFDRFLKPAAGAARSTKSP